MFRSLTLALAAASLALPAAAATSVRVNVAGLDAPSAHAAIVRAAKTACQIELRDSSTFEQHYHRLDCIEGAVARAESGLGGQTATTASVNPRTGR
jgi:hypothetical protein